MNRRPSAASSGVSCRAQERPLPLLALPEKVRRAGGEDHERHVLPPTRRRQHTRLHAQVSAGLRGHERQGHLQVRREADEQLAAGDAAHATVNQRLPEGERLRGTRHDALPHHRRYGPGQDRQAHRERQQGLQPPAQHLRAGLQAAGMRTVRRQDHDVRQLRPAAREQAARLRAEARRAEAPVRQEARTHGAGRSAGGGARRGEAAPGRRHAEPPRQGRHQRKIRAVRLLVHDRPARGREQARRWRRAARGRADEGADCEGAGRACVYTLSGLACAFCQSGMRSCRKYRCQYKRVIGRLGDEDVQVFVIRYGRSDRFDALLTTDMSLGFDKCLEIYQIRWGIEVMFKECKQHLGLGRCQCRDLDSQVSDASLCFLTHMLLTLDKRMSEYETLGGLLERRREELMLRTLWMRNLDVLRRCLTCLAATFNLSVVDVLSCLTDAADGCNGLIDCLLVLKQNICQC